MDTSSPVHLAKLMELGPFTSKNFLIFTTEAQRHRGVTENWVLCAFFVPGASVVIVFSPDHSLPRKH
jgi:hypothetical protein